MRRRTRVIPCVRHLGFKALRMKPWLSELPPNDELSYPLFVKCAELTVTLTKFFARIKELAEAPLARGRRYERGRGGRAVRNDARRRQRRADDLTR